MDLLHTPIIIINFKTYAEATGQQALALAKIAAEVRTQTRLNICIAPQATDIATIAANVDIPVFAQHVDPISSGAYTGHILPESIKEAGAIGVLINHSEKPLPLNSIEIVADRAKKLNLISVICSDTPKTAALVAYLKPDIVSVEPPDLIGTGIPVSKARPEEVLRTISCVKEVEESAVILCGAGITTGIDAKAALALGADGVLIASGIVKAKNPQRVLLEIAEAML
jgi:triosephosphate isomerase